MKFVGLDPMLDGQCRLCDAESSLQQSHILPAFAIRWLRDSSGTGHIRQGRSPNRRVQDGPKPHLLCTSCEGRLNLSETPFAEKLFHPFTNRESSEFVYGEWLLRFCVSMSWRVLQFYKDETSLKNYELDAVSRITEAEQTWKAFLMGQVPHPGPFQQHLLPVYGPEAIFGQLANTSPNINRYLMRTMDTDLVRGRTTNFVYSKLGRFIILGFIREDRPGRWQGSKVKITTGRIEPRRYSIPEEFIEYINSKARREAELIAGLSPRQREKMDQAYREKITAFIGSDAYIAMENDVRMFGKAAFISDSPTKGEKS